MSRWTNCRWLPVPTEWHHGDGRVEKVTIWLGPSDDDLCAALELWRRARAWLDGEAA